MTNSNFIIKIGQVESITDDNEGGRIKVRIIDDKQIPSTDLPFAFPLLPKVFHIIPKIGESVLVFLTDINDRQSDRYYIGPIISQMQYLEKDEYNYGRGTSTSLLNGQSTSPLTKISMFDITRGSFPDNSDISMLGRESEDVILKKGEVDIRCGIRGKIVGSDNPNLKGYIAFNDSDPAYIQMKYENNLISKRYGSNDKGTNSIINIVADKINLVSHSDSNQFDLTNKDNLIDKKTMQNMLDNMHPAAYADKIIEVLNLMRECIISHVHPYPGLPSCNTSSIQTLSNYNMDDIKSNFVRIS